MYKIHSKFARYSYLGGTINYCTGWQLSGHMTASSCECNLAITYFLIMYHKSFKKIYDNLCHLRWYQNLLWLINYYRPPAITIALISKAITRSENTTLNQYHCWL